MDHDERFDALERLAPIDPLTGLASRRGGQQAIAAEMSRAGRQNTPLSCVLLDIDQFKDVNDTYGRVAGDRVLCEIGAFLRSTVRPYDVVVRWGGDEFLIVLPGVRPEEARRLADRITHTVKMREITGVRPVAVSCVAAAIDVEYDPTEMLTQTYRRLHQAKRSGEGDSTDPHSGVREPRKHGPQDKSSAATVDEPEPERRVDAIERAEEH
jgi:diguanylate cyclase (GGDEF)-like protein